MTPMEEFYFKMGFLDCMQMYSQSMGDPKQALIKRMYVQDQMIPDVLPIHPPEDIMHRIADMAQRNFAEQMIEKYIKPNVEMQKMLDILKRSKFTSIYDLK